jgi:hypothetical protein
MEAMLKTYQQPQHKKNLFERMGVKEKPPQTKGGYVKNQHSEVLNQYQQIRNHIQNGNPYTKKHHPSNDEYQAATNIIGHTILVYTKNLQDHLQQANRFAPQGSIQGSPIVLVKSPQGIYTLDVQRTQHWSFYGAVASHFSSMTAEQLYDLVKQRTRQRLQSTGNEREYLDHHANAIPSAINTHELQTLADMLKRPIRTNPIMSMGYENRNSIRVTPSGWTGSKNTRDLVVLFKGNHYRMPKMTQNKGRSHQNMQKDRVVLSAQVETIIDLLNMENQQATPQGSRIRRNNEVVVPVFEQQELESIQEDAEKVQVLVNAIDSPADARRAEVAIHDLTGKFLKYTEQHHPEDLPMVIEQAKASPGLFNKIVKHTGSAVRATGRSAKGVVDRSSLGDFGVFGIALVSGLSVMSSYTSVWRVFFG